MSKVNTKERIMQAALELFMADGYQKTSIAKIESAAGLVPRAGAFYRHFESKEALLIAAAKAYVSETPEDFGLERLSDYGNTRAELVAIALKYEQAMERQKPYARLIEEIRLLDFGADFQTELNSDMFNGLVAWISEKPAAKGLAAAQAAALILTIIGGWMTYLSMSQRDSSMAALRDTMLNQWADHWAAHLDES